MVGDHNVLRGNCLQENGQYGFNAYNPGKVAGITIDGNEIAGNNTDDWEKLKDGCGCTGGGKFWEVTGAVVRHNWIHDNLSVGLWADTNNTGFVIEEQLHLRATWPRASCTRPATTPASGTTPSSATGSARDRRTAASRRRRCTSPNPAATRG